MITIYVDIVKLQKQECRLSVRANVLGFHIVSIWNSVSEDIAYLHYCSEGVFCGTRNAESCQRVICGKFNADFFCGMKGKVWNVTKMNIC